MDFTLDRIVRDFMIQDLGLESVDRRYARFMAIAISGLRELYYDNIGGVEKEVLIEVQDNGTANLPLDYIDYYAIGMMNGNSFLSFGLNSNLNALQKDDCGNKATSNMVDNNQVGHTFPISNENSLNENIGRFFGVGGGKSSIGEYKIYKELGYIALSGVEVSSIVLRYKADIQLVNEDYKVDGYSVSALRAYLWLQYVHRNRSFSLGEKQLAKQEYNKASKKALQRHYNFSIYEFLQAWKTGVRSSPKF